MKNLKGYIIIELFAYILVLGLLTAILIPQIRGTLSETKENATLEEMNNIKTALLNYYEDSNTMPPEYINVVVPGTSPTECAADSVHAFQNDYSFQIGITELLVKRCTAGPPNPTYPNTAWDGPYLENTSLREIQNDQWGRLTDYPWDWKDTTPGSWYYNFVNTSSSGKNPNIFPASYVYDKNPIINGYGGGENGSIKALIHSMGDNRAIDCEDFSSPGNTVSLAGKTPDVDNDNINVNWALFPVNTCSDDLVIQVSTYDIDKRKETETEQELINIRNALLGNPELTTNGSRSDFGFVGDIGHLPAALSELITNPGYSNWNGPYLTVNSNDDPLKDQWNQDYVYSPLASGGRNNRLPNITIDGDTNDIPLRSIGIDQGEDNACITDGSVGSIGCTCPNGTGIDRFCDDITLIEEDNNSDNVKDTYITSMEVIPASEFNGNVSFKLINRSDNDWPNSGNRWFWVRLDLKYRNGTGAFNTDNEEISLGVLFTGGNDIKKKNGSGIISLEFPSSPIAFTANNLPIGICSITANLFLDDDAALDGDSDNIQTIVYDLQILPNMKTVNIILDFGEIIIDSNWNSF